MNFLCLYFDICWSQILLFCVHGRSKRPGQLYLGFWAIDRVSCRQSTYWNIIIWGLMKKKEDRSRLYIASFTSIYKFSCRLDLNLKPREPSILGYIASSYQGCTRFQFRPELELQISSIVLAKHSDKLITWHLEHHLLSYIQILRGRCGHFDVNLYKQWLVFLLTSQGQVKDRFLLCWRF